MTGRLSAARGTRRASRPRAACAALALTVALLAGAARAAAQDEALPPFEELLPRDTVAWMGTDDTRALTAGWAATAQGRFFADPAFEPFYTALAEGLAWVGPRSREQLGVDLVELSAEFEGPLGVALLEMGAPVEPGGPPAMAAVFYAGLREGAADHVLDQLDLLGERWAEQAPDEIVQTFEERAGLQVSLLVDPDGDGTLGYAADQGVLLVTVATGAAQESAWLETLLYAVRGEGEDALAENPDFATSPLASEVAGGRMRVFLDMGAMANSAAQADGASPEEAQADLVEAGLADLGPLIVDSTADASGQRQRMSASWGDDFVAADLLEAAVAGQRPAAMAWMPPDAEVGVAVELDLGALFDTGLAMLTRNDPDAGRAMITGMAEAEAAFGFHPRDDLVEALSGQLGLFSKEPPGGVPPTGDPFAMMNTFALLVGLDDAQVVGEFFDAVIRSQGLHVAREREVFEGFEVYAVPVFPGLMLHYSLGGDVLTLSTNGELVRDVLRRRANPELASLATDEGHVAMRSRTPDAATAVLSMDAAASMRGTLELPSTFLGIIALGDPREIPKIPWRDGEQRLDVVLSELQALIPGEEILRKYALGRGVSTLVVSRNGIDVFTETP